jgi:hypothetical protein
MRQQLSSLSQILVILCLALGTACDSSPTGKQTTQAAAVPRNYTAVLLRTGLVKPQHRRWLLFCDTTHVEGFQLGHTARRVRGWLSEYEALQEKHWHFNPDSLRIASGQEMRNSPPPLPMMATAILLPTTPQEKQRARAQTTLLVKQLRQAQLLTSDEYRILLPLAQAGGFYSRRNLLYNTTDILAVAYRLRTSRQLAPILQQIGMLTPPQARQLALDLRSGLIHDPVELLARLPGGRVFRRTDYPAALMPYLRQLHQDVARLLPGLVFSDFRAEVVQPGQLSYCTNCPEDQDVVVHLRVGGRKYAHRSALSVAGEANGSSVYPEQFYQIFNQVLADRALPYRLVLVESGQETYLSGTDKRFGLWRLTTAQHEALDTLEYSALHSIGPSGFDLLPTDTVTNALRAFDQLGLLRHLSPSQRAAAEIRLRQARLSEREEVLHYVPGSLGEYRGAPDYATWSYARLLAVLSRLSGGQFRPLQVQDRASQAGGTLRFALGRQSYQTTLDPANEAPDARLFQLVQQALREQQLPGKFFEVSPGLAQSRGMVTGYVFLQPEQEQIIRRKQLLHLIDPTLSEEEQYAQEEAEGAAGG